MSDWPTIHLAPAPRVVLTGEPPPLSDAIAARVRSQWLSATAERPELYDGRIFTATDITPETITGFWCPYSRAMTQMREPTLYAELALRPLAVTALLLCSEGAVLGRRSNRAIYQPGLWQGVPAGSVESRSGESDVDLPEQLRAEFLEELGLDARALTIGRARVACEHPDTHIIDVAFEARTTLSFTDLEALWRQRGNEEYEALRLVPPGAFTEVAQDETVLPTTVAMLHALRS